MRTIYDGYLDSGYQSMKWNGQNDNGATLPSGFYIMRLNYDNQTITNKMVKLKKLSSKI